MGIGGGVSVKLGVYLQRRKHLKGAFGGLMSLCYIIQV